MQQPGAESDVEAITDAEFEQYRRFIYQHAGIDMSPQKRHLVSGRLHKRLTHYGFRQYGEYFRFVSGPEGSQERQLLVDLLTTNETYFFREPDHFDFLRDRILPAYRGGAFRAWSAACSSGEEVYTLAMVMAETLGQADWQVLGTDISQRVLATARQAVYPMARTRDIPRLLLQKYCLKGVRSQQGQFQIDGKLRQRTRFDSVNLKTFRAARPMYDLIFLRNVLIYFDAATKRDVIGRIAAALHPGGHLFVSHVESLHGIADQLQMLQPSIFRKPER